MGGNFKKIVTFGTKIFCPLFMVCPLFEMSAVGWFHCNKIRTRKSSMKTKWLTTRASTLQQQAHVQIPNLIGRLTLFRKVSRPIRLAKISVILNQWWSFRIQILKQTNQASTRKYLNKLWTLEYFGPASLPLFPSEMDDEEKIRLFEEQRKLANEKIIIGCKRIRENTHI